LPAGRMTTRTADRRKSSPDVVSHGGAPLI
jgi:hypothetical protein